MTRTEFLTWWTWGLVAVAFTTGLVAVPAFLIDRRGHRLWPLRTSARWAVAILLLVLALLAVLPLLVLRSSGAAG